MHLYESIFPSGNAYKIHLILAHLKIPYQITSLDTLATPSETRTSEFLALNSNGRIPLLVLDDGTPLAESSAILFYLGDGTQYLPDDKLKRTQVLQWLFFEQNSHEPYVGSWKFCTYWGNGFGNCSETQKQDMKQRGQAAIDVMEQHLEGKEWFVGGQYSIADISLYAHTSAAEAIGFQIGSNVRAWLSRVEATEGFVRIKKDPTRKCPL